eukprot:6180589-Pleurochrysis_carterae.AAC.1
MRREIQICRDTTPHISNSPPCSEPDGCSRLKLGLTNRCRCPSECSCDDVGLGRLPKSPQCTPSTSAYEDAKHNALVWMPSIHDRERKRCVEPKFQFRDVYMKLL